MRKILCGLVLAVASSAFGQTGSVADRVAKQNALFDEFYEVGLKNSPERATSVGDYRYNALLSQASLAEIKRQHDEANDFLKRLKERTENRDKAVSILSFNAQLKAIKAWALQAPDDLSRIHHPVLVANGDQDKMVPSINSADLARRLPHAELVLYEDAGHGGIFQYHEAFVKKALAFLEAQHPGAERHVTKPGESQLFG